MAKSVFRTVARASTCLALVGLLTSGCGPFEDQWQDAKSCMESRGADGEGPANFRDDLPADNGYVLRLHDRASDTDWKVTMYFFDDAESATEAMEAYRGPPGGRTPSDAPTYRKGRVFVRWETTPESWEERYFHQAPPDRPPHPEPPRLLRRDIVDPCLSHQ